MTSPQARPALDVLLAQSDWVRALARRLADDSADADDLEQDAWLAAAKARPHDGRGIRAWFATVMRRRAAERHRLAVRRDAREALAARPEGTRGGASVVADAEAFGRVVQAVLALEEPWRETVLLRFYEGLPPREISARTQVPVDTVRTRLRRAAELLRAALGGRREDWLGAIAPLLVLRPDAPPGAASAAAGGLAMKATTKAAIAAAALLAATAAVLWNAPRGGSDGGGPGPDETPRDLAASDRGDPGPAKAARRRPPRAGADTATTDDAETSETRTSPAAVAPLSPGTGRVVGRVLLPDGTPAVGAAIGGPGSSGWTAADADGRYAVAVASREDCAEQPLWVLLPGYCAAGIGLFRVEPGADLRAEDLKLVADGVVVVRGRVVSRAGNEISSGQVGATIVTESRLIDTARRSRDPGPLLMLEAAWPGESRPSALSDFDTARRATVGAGGSFELRLPASLGVVTLFADVAGHASEWPGPRSVQEWAQREVELLVSPTRGIRGRVVDAVTGSPIEGAVVGEGAGAVKTDLEGTFDWAAGGGRGTWARVAARGYFVTNVSGPEGGDAITVKLWRRRTLAGTVRLADGSAVTGAFVAVVAAGSGQGSENARTDATGRFRFDEVRDGRLAVVVQPTPDSPSFLTKEFEDVAAGDMGLDLVVDPGLTVAGRIVDGDGRPVPRMHVVPLAVANESARRSGHIFSAVSGADGTFVVNGLPSGRHDLNVYDAFDEAGGWLPEMRKGVEAGTADLVVVVTKGLTISGRVTDGDGRPAFGKRVIADDVATNPLLGGFGNGPELDADGRFVLRGLRPGRYRLELGDVTNDPTRFQLAGGASVEAGAKDVALTLLDGGSIAGIVRDAAGEAVAGEWVTLLWTAADASGRNAQSDEKGRFEFRGLPLGHAYAVKARGALVRDVALGTHDVRLEVRPAEK